jgi:putative DNA primase/helicase
MTSVPDVPDLLPYGLNDDGNSQRFVLLYGDRFRYCHAFDKWLYWDGSRWLIDGRQKALDHARDCMREFHSQAVGNRQDEKADFAHASLNKSRASNLLWMSQPTLHIPSETLDSSPWLLNFTNGTMDLETGDFHLHSPLDYITKRIDYPYDPYATCPTWTSFISQTMCRSKSMIHYIQKALGYSLTGITHERAVFLLYGTGNNGKTTLLSTIQELIPAYSLILRIEALIATHESNNNEADLADLQGKRFVITSESDQGHRLMQGRLKRLSQGTGSMRAVRKYENPITFEQTHKIWMDTNHLPIITDADDIATMRRLHPIHFQHIVPKDKIDPDLSLKLRAEAPGILAWLVEGAALWQKERLGKPRAVETATEELRLKNDWLERFLHDRCLVAPGRVAFASELYAAYEIWAEEGGEGRDCLPRSVTQFGRSLNAHEGISRGRNATCAFYKGVGLRPSNGRIGSTPEEQSNNSDGFEDTDEGSDLIQ